jgi:hypothetical protein
VLGDQRARLDDDVVDFLDHLQALIEIHGMKAEPFAEDLHEVDDFEAAPVAGIAKLAVAGDARRRLARRRSTRAGGRASRR